MLRTEIVGSGNMYLEDLCTKWYTINTGDRTRSTYQDYLTKPQNTLYKYNRLNVQGHDKQDPECPCASAQAATIDQRPNLQ